MTFPFVSVLHISLQMTTILVLLTWISNGFLVANTSTRSQLLFLAKPKASRNVKKRKVQQGTPGFGGERQQVPVPSASVTNHTKDQLQQQDLFLHGTAKNLFSICAHLQNPHLYEAAKWAHVATWQQQDQRFRLVASENVHQSGQVLSLLPIHGLGVQTYGRKKERVVFNVDHPEDLAYFQKQENRIFEPGYRMRVSIMDNEKANPFFTKPRKLQREHSPSNLYIHVNPHRREQEPGWLGHLSQRTNSSKDSNCILVPLIGAEPLCALISTTVIEHGQELWCCETIPDDETIIADLARTVSANYKNEIDELRSYLNMAFPLQEDDTLEDMDTSDADTKIEATTSQSFAHPFLSINLNYPNLQCLHQDPTIYTIPNFLSDLECDRLVAKAAQHLTPCLAKNEATGVVEVDPTRTSTNANIPQREVPGVVQKIKALLGNACEHVDSQMEILQLLHYAPGQQFLPHTDGFDGPTSACGFEKSGRIATIFCYLNNVQHGGHTRFTKLLQNDAKGGENLYLDIVPRKGTAVVHFPSTLGLEEDVRTEHAGMPVTDASEEKWLLTTWIWKDQRVDPRYAEDKLHSLSEDRI